MKICFSILHYGPSAVTKDCIESILKLNNQKKIEIVIVDNHSDNGSLHELKLLYDSNSRIHFLSNAENLGFAKGNNKGFQFAKNNLSADVICVINNDILFHQIDFIDILEQSINKYNNVDVIAPSIVNSKGYFQNPLRKKEIETREIFWGIFYNMCMYIIYLIPLLNYRIAGYLENRRNIRKNEEIQENIFDIVPHGSAIIYSKGYVKNEDNAFLEDTFLFGEEDFLYIYLKKKNYTTMYDPALKIIHNEDASIKAITKDYVSKRAFISKKKITSLIKLLLFKLK